MGKEDGLKREITPPSQEEINRKQGETTARAEAEASGEKAAKAGINGLFGDGTVKTESNPELEAKKVEAKNNLKNEIKKVLSGRDPIETRINMEKRGCEDLGITQAELDEAEAEVCRQLGIDVEKHREAKTAALEEYKRTLTILDSIAYRGKRSGIEPTGRAGEEVNRAFSAAEKRCESLGFSRDDLYKISKVIGHEISRVEEQKTLMRDYVDVLKSGGVNWQIEDALRAAIRAGATQEQMSELYTKFKQGKRIEI